MTVQAPQNHLQTISHRFFRYLIDLKFALRAEDFDDGLIIDFEKPQQSKKEEEEQVERILLDVEKKRVERERQKKEDEVRAIAEMSAWIHPRIFQHAVDKLEDSDYVLNSLLRFSHNFTDLTAILYSPSMTYTRVANVVKAKHSLERTLLQMINQQKFQLQIGRKVNRVIKEPQVAISMLGVDGAKALLPIMLVKQAVKLNNDLFPLLGFKLWKHMLSTGLATHHLLESSGYHDPVEGLLAGTLAHVGIVACYHQFLLSFDEVKTLHLKEFRQRGKKQFHDNLLNVDADSAIPFKLFKHYAGKISTDVLNQLELHKQRPKGMAASIDEFNQNVPFNDCSDMAKALHQATFYSQFEQMRQAKLIGKDEISQTLKEINLSSAGLQAMVSKNLTRLNLRTFVE